MLSPILSSILSSANCGGCVPTKLAKRDQTDVSDPPLLSSFQLFEDKKKPNGTQRVKASQFISSVSPSLSSFPSSYSKYHTTTTRTKMNNQFTNPPPESPTRKQHHVDQVGGGAQPLTTPPMTPTMGAAMAAIPPAADPQTPLKTRSRTVSAHSWPPPASPAIGLPNRYTNTSEPRVLVGSAAEDNVRALATELGQSMFRNVSASRASIFLDPVVSGRFVSMPHIVALDHLMTSLIARRLL
ncbi:hypothetical protein BC828DRAFT_139361 [Blastocladiella britannica]|nr:hypothetical protein BC828DRAFT_139361 [Blastocladiella britannica]